MSPRREQLLVIFVYGILLLASRVHYVKCSGSTALVPVKDGSSSELVVPYKEYTTFIDWIWGLVPQLISAKGIDEMVLGQMSMHTFNVLESMSHCQTVYFEWELIVKLVSKNILKRGMFNDILAYVSQPHLIIPWLGNRFARKFKWMEDFYENAGSFNRRKMQKAKSALSATTGSSWPPAARGKRWLKEDYDALRSFKKCIPFTQLALGSFAFFYNRSPTAYWQIECYERSEDTMRYYVDKVRFTIANFLNGVPGYTKTYRFFRYLILSMKQGYKKLKAVGWKFLHKLPLSYLYVPLLESIPLDEYFQDFFMGGNVGIDDIAKLHGRGCTAQGLVTLNSHFAAINGTHFMTTEESFGKMIMLPPHYERKWKYLIAIAKNAKSMMINEMRCGCAELAKMPTTGLPTKWSAVGPWVNQVSNVYAFVEPKDIKRPFSGYVFDHCHFPNEATVTLRVSPAEISGTRPFGTRFDLGDHVFVRIPTEYFRTKKDKKTKKSDGRCLYLSTDPRDHALTVAVFLKRAGDSGCTPPLRKTLKRDQESRQYLGQFDKAPPGGHVVVFLAPTGGKDIGKEVDISIGSCEDAIKAKTSGAFSSRPGIGTLMLAAISTLFVALVI